LKLEINIKLQIINIKIIIELSIVEKRRKCVVPENIHTPPRKVTGNSEGEGGSKAEISEGSGGFIGGSFSRG